MQRQSIAFYQSRERPVAEPECDPMPEETLAPMIEHAAKPQKLPPKLIRNMVARESAFRPCAVSKKGATGLLQLMPATADEFAVDDPFDPAENLAAGAKYLRQLLDRYGGDVATALAAYNAGPAAVDMAKGIPDIPETVDYVKAIVEKLDVKRIDPLNIPMPKPIGN